MDENFKKLVEAIAAILEVIYKKKLRFAIVFFDENDYKNGHGQVSYATNSDNQTAAEKFYFVADKIDPNRNFPETIGQA